jgi:GNAT superfamily N-acetyltransferase
MTRLLKTTSENSDFRALVADLDAHLTVLNGDKNDFYVSHNKVDAINHVIVAFHNGVAVGCGGIKAYSERAMEVKRMYVKPENRGQGIASDILTSLETWATTLGYNETILETLRIKESVIAMYARNGYSLMPNYGQYANVDSSVCMNKKL